MRVSTSPVHNSACTDIKESAVGVCAEIAKLQRVLGKTTLENEILKEAVEYVAEKSGLRARPCCPGTTSENWSADDGAGALACARPDWAR